MTNAENGKPTPPRIASLPELNGRGRFFSLVGISSAIAAFLVFGSAGCKESPGLEQIEATKRTIEEAKAKTRALAEAEDRRIEKAGRQTQAEAARRTEEEQRRMKTERAERERAETERQAKAAKEEAVKRTQAESLKVAAEAFGRISLNPQITVPNVLKNENVIAELKGQDLEKFRALFATKDWLGMLKALGTVNADEQNFPPAKDVQTAADTFARTKTFPLLIKAPVVQGGGFLGTVNELAYWLVSLPEKGGGNQVFRQLIRTKHPDGIGYIADWRPALGNVLIVAATTEQLEAQTRKIDDALAALTEGLNTKIRLGEINKEDARKQLAETWQQYRTHFLEWAEVATPTLKPTLIGIGASLALKGNAIVVTSIIAGGPAERDGELRVGDRIIAFADGTPGLFAKIEIPETVDKMEGNGKLNELRTVLRGKEGSAVYLKVQPAGTNDPSQVKTIKIIRAKFTVK